MPQIVRNIAQSSIIVMSGPRNRIPVRTGWMTDVMNARTISFIPAATTAPIAFSARNFVPDTRPNGKRIPTQATKR